MDKQCMLTTLDNPYNPFVDFSSWYMFDCEQEHNTSSRLARIVNIDSEMTQKERDEEIDRAMDFIVTYDLEGIFVKGTEEQIEELLKNRRNELKNNKKQTATATNA